MHEVYERCNRKFGYEWKIMTQNPKKESHCTCEACVMRLVSNKFMSLFLFFKREKLTEEY